MLGVTAACLTASSTARAEPQSDPIEAYRRGSAGGQSGDANQGQEAQGDDGQIRLAGAVVRPRRIFMGAGYHTRFFRIDGATAVYSGGEITTGLMVRYFELLLRVAVDVAVVEPTQAPNMRSFVRNDILIGTNAELRRNINFHIRAGPRIILFKGYSGVLGTGISFHPRHRLVISLDARATVGTQYLQWETESEETFEERKIIWGLGFALAVGAWL